MRYCSACTKPCAKKTVRITNWREEDQYLNWFTTASARGLFDYDLKDKIRNNGVKLIVNHFNTLVAKLFYPIIITTWNALPNEVVISRTANSFKNSLDKHVAENPPDVWVNSLQSSMSCIIQGWKAVVGQRFAGNGPNGLSYTYYYRWGKLLLCLSSCRQICGWPQWYDHIANAGLELVYRGTLISRLNVSL